MKKNGLKYVILVTVAIVLSACGQIVNPQSDEVEEKESKIVTTFFPIYDFTRNIVGSDDSIEMLIDGSVEPHEFEPSAKDIAKIQDADVFIYNSTEMETWVSALLDSIDTSQVTIIEAGEGLDLLAGSAHDHDSADEHHDHEADGEHDDHDRSGLHLHGVKDHYHTGETVKIEAHGFADFDFEQFSWLLRTGDDPFVAIEDEATEKVSFKIEESAELLLKLIAKDGEVVAATEPITLQIDNHEAKEAGHEHSHEYDPHVWLDPRLVKKEVATITAGLSGVNPAQKARYEKNSKDYQKKLDELDKAFEAAFKGAKNRRFITQHTAFAYLAERYQLEQLGISGLSPDLEPTAKELADIETFVKKHDVTVIFTEDMSSPKIAETIASATGATLETLSPIEGITAQEQKEGVDYLEVMKRNLKALELVIK